MKRIRYYVAAALALASFAGYAQNASATPLVNGAVIVTRVFNDCPTSNVTTANFYPGSINITDSNNDCFGFANRHAWSFSADGGATAADFANGDQFSYCATLVIDGTGGGEGGLRLSPWYSLDVDGTFNCRTTDGEIACFGGRLPFYSFSDPAHGGVRYIKGTPIKLSIDYKPNGLSQASPATIVYTLVYGANTFTSGPLAFDEGNTAEDPPHGLWGILTPARVGGHLQCFVGAGTPVSLSGTWTDICFDAGATPATPTSWGKIKGQYR
jgi:hypothetical protein